MSKTIVFSCCLLMGLVIVFVAIRASQKNKFQLTSNDVKQDELLKTDQVYDAHGCSGKNISPQLAWRNAPKETQSFAIICHDPDAPHTHGWYHWLVVNIPASVNEVSAGAKIAGALETITDFKQNAYGGACPPIGHGIHHYNFTIYALDTAKLDVSAEMPPFEVEKIVKAHALAQATITGLYERK